VARNEIGGVPAGAGPRASDADRAAVAAAVSASGSSFTWAMRLLDAPRRDGMFAVYAFCRAVDDVVDEPGTPEEKASGLAFWRAEVGRLRDGAPQSPIGRALVPAFHGFDLREADFLALIDGMEMDAGAPIVAPDLATLDLYCARVASAVGHLAVRIFGAPTPAGARVADHLGRALQYTNILRDLAEDAELGRLYLPREYLDDAGITTRVPAEVLRHPALPVVCRRVAALAGEHFTKAEAAMRECPRRAMRPARVMMSVYRLTYERLLKADWRDPFSPVKVSKALKLALALRHGLV
jgi:phytoene synthase